MKIVASLTLLVLMLSAVTAGCQQATTEVAYRDVSVNSMRLSIPSDWQKPEDTGEIVRYIRNKIIGLVPGMEQYIQVDCYQDPESEHMSLFLATMAMSKIVESEGTTWEGWVPLLEAEGMTKRDFLAYLIAGLTSEGIEEVNQEPVIYYTINYNEAVEAKVTGRVEGERTTACLLLIFAENDLGMVLIIGEGSAWEKYEGNWDAIRNSVRF